MKNTPCTGRFFHKINNKIQCLTTRISTVSCGSFRKELKFNTERDALSIAIFVNFSMVAQQPEFLSFSAYRDNG